MSFELMKKKQNKTEINQVRNSIIETKRNLENEISVLRKEVQKNTQFIEKVKKDWKILEMIVELSKKDT